MIPELRNNIADLGITITGLSSRFYFMEAPEKTVMPYSVFSQIANPFSRDSKSKFEEVYIQINTYSKSASECETVAEAVKAKFDDSESLFTSLSVYHLDRIERQLTRDQKIEKVFMNSVQYKLELTKN